MGKDKRSATTFSTAAQLFIVASEVFSNHFPFPNCSRRYTLPSARHYENTLAGLDYR